MRQRTVISCSPQSRAAPSAAVAAACLPRRGWPVRPMPEKRRPHRLAAIDSPVLDAPLYAVAALVALLLWRTSGGMTYRLWGQVAVGVFAAAAGWSLWLGASSRLRSAPSCLRKRIFAAGVVLLGVVVVPLVLEVALRAGSGPQYAQDEVLMTERAAGNLRHGISPYVHPVSVGESEARRFPYLPLMAVFGAAHAQWPSQAWTDARVMFTATTLVVTAAALGCWQVPAERRLRVLQLFLLMPNGSLYLVTGGDDLPVLALMLLALATRTAKSGALLSAAGIASAALMKVTAWPLLIALLVCRKERALRLLRASAWPYLAVPAVLIAVLAWDGRGLVEDSVLYPLGLLDQVPGLGPPLDWASVHGPLAAHLVPAACVATAGVLVLALLLHRHRRGYRFGGAEAPAVLAAGLLVVPLLILGDELRPGLWLYPVDLCLWSLFGVGRPGRSQRAT